jgi:hypothetical protein
MHIQLSRVVLLSIGCALLSSPAFADTIYKWEDESGHPHYSDVPRDGAVEVDVEPAQTFSAPSTARRSSSSATQAPVDKDQMVTVYKTFEIVRPRTEETFWNTGGNLNLTVSLQPGLQVGHRIQAYLDGKALGETPAGMTTTTLSGLSRGEHKVHAEVRDETGKVIRRAPAVTFFVQQSTAQANDRGKPGPPIPAPTGPVARSQLPAMPRTRPAR